MTAESSDTRKQDFHGLRTRDGFFATDSQQRVIHWSESAERITGIRAEEALGQPCFDVFVGMDYAGNPFCRRRCPVASNASKGRAVRDYDVVVHTPDGRAKLVNNSVVLWPLEEGGHAIVHLFREVRSPRQPTSRKSRRSRTAGKGEVGGPTPLSRREVEALRLAATGLRTSDVAVALGVSYYTARNQLASAMQKLNSRNRIEAIARAGENGLL